MPRTGVLGQATRIDPEPEDHEAFDELRTRDDLGEGKLVLRTADVTYAQALEEFLTIFTDGIRHA